MGFQEDMQRELDAAQKEFDEDSAFVSNRDLFLKYFFDDETQKSKASRIVTEGSNLAGAAGGMAAASAYFLGHVGIWGALVGATTPIGWLAAGAGVGYLGMKYLNKSKHSIDSTLYEKTAKYISCPMDQVARGLCELTMPIVISAAYSDGNYCSDERELIVKHFVQKWGLNPKAVDELMAQFESNDPENWDSLELAGTIQKSIEELLKGAAGIDRRILAEKVCAGAINLAIQVIEADGIVHRSEIRFIKRLGADLGLPELVKGLIDVKFSSPEVDSSNGAFAGKSEEVNQSVGKGMNEIIGTASLGMKLTSDAISQVTVQTSQTVGRIIDSNPEAIQSIKSVANRVSENAGKGADLVAKALGSSTKKFGALLKNVIK